jgi:hypothetical protein
MVQHIYTIFGASVTLDINYNNIKLIQNLIDIENSNEYMYFITYNNHKDEISKIEEKDKKLLSLLLKVENERDFNEIFRIRGKDINIHNSSCYFIYNIGKAYAKNISSRQNPRIFGNINNNFEIFRDKIDFAKNFFLENGVCEENIMIGYIMTESS